MRTYEISRQIDVPRSLDDVFAFFSDASNLQTLTPAWLRFEILTAPPIVMAVGTEIRYRIRVRGLPMNWLTEITVWEPPHRFVDVQRRGPYRLWVHEHTFERSGSATRVRDHVRYAVPGGALVNRLLVRPDLEKVFDYRQRQMRTLFA